MVAKVAFLLIIGCATVLAQRDSFWTTLRKFAEQQQNAVNNGQESGQISTQNQADLLNMLLQQAGAQGNGNNPSWINNLQNTNQHWSSKVNSNYQTPLLDVPYRAVDQVQHFADDAISKVGGALDKTWDSTQKLAENALSGVQTMGAQGVYDGMNVAKNGLGIFSTFPKIGLGLFTQRNN